MTEFRFPYRDRDDPLLVDLGNLTRETLDGDEIAITRQVGLQLAADGATTVGDALDKLEAAGPDGRREIVDRARAAVGLDTIADAETHRKLLAANAALRPGRDSQGKVLQSCAAEGCPTYSTDESGLLAPVVDRRWWCDTHKHLAGPEDHLPPADRFEIDFGTMSLRAIGEERERLDREEAERQEEERERAEQRRLAAEATQAARERWERDHGPDVMGVPMSRVTKR